MARGASIATSQRFRGPRPLREIYRDLGLRKDAVSQYLPGDNLVFLESTADFTQHVTTFWFFLKSFR